MDFLFDILFNKRLYCAEVHTLNDPVEGQFDYYDIDLTCTSTDINASIDSFRVCSLSKTYDSHLLWAHYASGFRGVAIEFDIEPNDELIEIEYTGLFSKLALNGNEGADSIAHRSLSLKYDAWSYEQEYRLITKNVYYELKQPISKIIVGHRMPRALFDALRIVCERLNIKFVRTGIGKESIEIDNFPEYGKYW